MKFLSKFRKDEEGAAAVEYALLATLISVFIIAALTALGPALSGAFTAITNAITGVTGP